MVYSIQSIHKVDKILGPGNQFVTMIKMLVSYNTAAGVSINMPAGPSKVLVHYRQACKPCLCHLRPSELGRAWSGLIGYPYYSRPYRVAAPGY
jgi:hypothetical protein